MNLKLYTLTFMVFSSEILFPATACERLEPGRAEAIIERLSRRLALPQDSLLTISNEFLVEKTCYRLIRLKIGSTNRTVLAYLSPDQRFLSTQVSDLNEAVEDEAAREASWRTQLLAEGAPVRGPQDAPIDIYVFEDFQCPYCAQLNELLTNTMGSDKRFRIAFKHFPLPMHSWARSASELAACVLKQSEPAFWSLHDYLFSHQNEIALTTLPDVMARLAIESRFDGRLLQLCMEKGTGQIMIDNDLALARELRLVGTPSLIINGHQVATPTTPQDLKEILDRAITQHSKL